MSTTLTAEQLATRGGPYTPSEFLKMNPPPERAAPDLPDEVVQAAADVDSVVAERDSINARYVTAVRQMRAAKSHAQHNEAKAGAELLAEMRAEVDERVRAARQRYHRLRKAHSEKVRIEEYMHSSAVMAAEKEAQRAADREAQLRQFDVRTKA